MTREDIRTAIAVGFLAVVAAGGFYFDVLSHGSRAPIQVQQQQNARNPSAHQKNPPSDPAGSQRHLKGDEGEDDYGEEGNPISLSLVIQIVSVGIATWLAWLVYRVYQRQADLMNDSLAANKAMQRAHLAVDADGVVQIWGSLVGRDSLVEIMIRNAGHLTARKIKWDLRAEISADPRRERFDVTDEPKIIGNNILVPGGDMRRVLKIKFAQDDVRNFENHGHTLYVWGIVHYADGFEKNRFLRFCHRYETDSMKSGGLMADRARQHQYGNGTDEDEGST
jgi:hypothetical protein